MNYHLNRRHLLSFVASGGALAACSTASSNVSTTISMVASDIGDIAAAFISIMPVVGSVGGISAKMVATIGAAVADLQNLAQAIKMVTDANAAQPIVKQVEADLNAIVSALAGATLIPGPISLALQAASVLLPIIELAVNLVVPQSFVNRAARVHMTPDEARLKLRALAHK